MNDDRRNILKLLGLTAVGGTVSTEAIGASSGEGYPAHAMRSVSLQNSIAESLERLAAAIRRGDVAATSVDVHSSLRMDEWISHEVKVNVEILKDQVG